MPLLLSLPQVAELLGAGIGKRTIQRRVASGEFPKPYKLGGRAVWRTDDIELFVSVGCSMANFRRAKTEQRKPHST
jgi:predicted DNA-binding transcriptional regulator AlpA